MQCTHFRDGIEAVLADPETVDCISQIGEVLGRGGLNGFLREVGVTAAAAREGRAKQTNWHGESFR